MQQWCVEIIEISLYAKEYAFLIVSFLTAFITFFANLSRYSASICWGLDFTLSDLTGTFPPYN